MALHTDPVQVKVMAAGSHAGILVPEQSRADPSGPWPEWAASAPDLSVHLPRRYCSPSHRRAGLDTGSHVLPAFRRIGRPKPWVYSV